MTSPSSSPSTRRRPGRIRPQVGAQPITRVHRYPILHQYVSVLCSSPSGALQVVGIDMCQPINKPQHNTSAYDITHLIVRRGQPFTITVTFDRQLGEGDDFQLEFLIGE